MLAVTKGDITIREMGVKDVGSLVKSANLASKDAARISKCMREQIKNKNDESNLLFTILYNDKIVGKIDVLFTDEYKKDPKYKGLKTDANMMVEIPNVQICDKIYKEVFKVFIEYCKEECFLDVLGVPHIGPMGLFWRPIVILGAA